MNVNGQRIIVEDVSYSERLTQLFAENEIKREDEGRKDLMTVPAEGINLLIQPKTVTSGEIPKELFAEEILTEVVRSLQPYMTPNPEECPSSKFYGRLRVTVDMSAVAGFHENRKDIEAALTELETKRFGFGWTQKSYVNSSGVTVPEHRWGYTGVMFTGHAWTEDSYLYHLTVNSMALPFLTFIGRGVGYTGYLYSIYCGLTSEYQRKLYQWLCEWSSQSLEYRVPLSELREILQVPKSYQVCNIKQQVLDPMSAALDNLKSPVRMTYELVYESGGADVHEFKRKGYNTVIFRFICDNRVVPSDDSQKCSVLCRCFESLADREKRRDISLMVEEIVRMGKLDTVWDKFRYYNHQSQIGKLADAKMKNILLKILREDCGIELRSGEHIRRAAVKRARNLGRSV